LESPKFPRRAFLRLPFWNKTTIKILPKEKSQKWPTKLVKEIIMMSLEDIYFGFFIDTLGGVALKSSIL